jgi:RNA polymerase sigma-70 factor (ECF subfamily)
MKVNSYTTLSDSALIARFQQEEPAAFQELFNRHNAYVYKFLCKRTQDDELARDLLQDTYLKAVTAIKNGRYNLDVSYFRTWLCTISYRTLIDYEKHHHGVSLVNIDDFFSLSSCGDYDPEQALFYKETCVLIKQTIVRRRPALTDIAELRFFQGYKYEEIAERLGIPLNTLKTKIRELHLLLFKLAEIQD